MKRLKSPFFLFIFVAMTGLVNQANAQILPTKALEKPAKYTEPFDEQDLASAKEILPYQVWRVFSDRENNVTYKDPGSTVVKMRLAFFDEFYAVQEYETEAKEQYIRLVKDPNMDGLKLSPNARDYGWIKKENMLLWEQCLVTKEGKINRKAMILNTIEHLKNLASGEANLVEFRRGPSSDAEKTGETSRLFQFFFIYKTTSTFVLLGKEERVPADEASRKQIIVGWAPKERLTFWDHRIAVEPNWDEAAVAERKTGHRAIFLKNVPAAIQYKKGKPMLIQDIIWNGDPLNKRPIGEWRRFPRLGIWEKDSIITAGVMGEILDSEGKTVATDKSMATMQRANNEQNDKTRQTNVVFVVDGTNSVRPYFPNVSQAIKNSMKALTGSRNTFRFGIVVYRDWDEGRERLTQIFPIGDYQDAAEFLGRIQAKDVADTSQAEAVFYGLKTALLGTGMGDRETNVIILIGDAGNHHRNDPSQVDEMEIVNLLVQKTCHFFTAQVNHKSHPAYREFVPQVQSLIMQSAQKIYELDALVRAAMNKSYPPPSWQQQGKAFKLSDGGYLGWVLPTLAGQSLSAFALEKEISAFVSKLEPANNDLVGAAIDMFEGGKSLEEVEVNQSDNPYAGALGPRIVDHLRKLGVTPQSLASIKGKRYQLYLRASAPLTVVGQKERLFKQVLLLSRAELFELWQSMNKLTEAGDLRSKMQETWLSILKNYTGDVIDSKLNELSMERVNEMVFGLPGNSSFLKQIRLIDILDARAFPGEQFEQYRKRIVEKAKKLYDIGNQDVGEFLYSFKSNEQTYYWIDEDLIP